MPDDLHPPLVQRITQRAFARVGLLGNPSDGYGGRVIAFTIADFHARVEARDATGICLARRSAEGANVGNAAGLERALSERSLGGGAALLGAALTVFARRFPELEVTGLELGFESDVPRQVGLAGSSAIVVAALRALCARYEVALATDELARLALGAENDVLGITAGPQDRVVQAREGLVDMDFARWVHQALDPRLLPPLFVAWDPEPGADSGAVHGALRARHAAGDAEVAEAMRAIAALAARGAECLRAGDVETLRALVDENFDRRASVFPIAPRHRALVELGRRHGAAAKFAGSGGAVVGVPRAEAELIELERAYVGAGWRFLRPTLQVPRTNPEENTP